MSPSPDQIWHSNNPALTDAPAEQSPDSDGALPGGLRPHGKWMEPVRHFTPSWFAVAMGTGVVASLLNQLPYNGTWLYWISVVVFALNTFLFAAALIISSVRYIMWPKVWSIMIRDPHHSLFLGAVPIGFATIINMFFYVCVPAWGRWALHFGWGLWILDALAAVGTALLIPFMIMSHGDEMPLSRITALQLMPVSSTIVAAASGSVVAEAMDNSQKAFGTILASWILWGIGTPLAFMVLVMYYQRLTLTKLPPREAIVSVFLPLSPLGQASLAATELGSAALKILPVTGTVHESAGPVVFVCGWLIGLLLWAFTLVWLALAISAVLRLQRFPFNMGWWSFTFPLGSLSLATIALAKATPSAFFRVLGTIFAVCAIIFWMIVVGGTLRAAFYGKLLRTSCVATWEQQRDPPDASKRACVTE